MKKQYQIGLFALFFFLAGATNAQSVFWRISGKGLEKPSYLFGTIHIQDKQIFELSDSLLPAIEKADYLALELDLSAINPIEMVGLMMLPDGKTLKDVFSKEEYALIKQEFESQTGNSIEPFSSFKPFTLLTFIMLTHLDESDNAPMALDQFLNYYAMAKNTPVLGIENVEEQLKVMDEMPSRAIIEALTEEDSVNVVLNDIITAYVNGDLATVAKLMKEDKTYGKWMSQLIDERNKIMFDKTYERIKSGESLVIAVGTGHLAGKKGLIELYRKKGFKVEPIITNKTAVSDADWDELMKFKKF